MKHVRKLTLFALFPAFIAAMVFLGFDIYFHIERIMYSIAPGYYATVGFFSTFVLFASLILLSWFLPWHFPRVFLFAFALLIQVMMLIYYILQGGFLDYALIRTNFAEIMTLSGWRTILGTSGVTVWVLCAAGLIAAVTWAHHKRYFDRGELNRPFYFFFFLSLVAVAAFFELFPFNPSPLYNFAWGVRRFNQDLQPAFFSFEDHERYPYVKDFRPAHPWPKARRRPDVFIVMIESFSGLYIDQKTDDGREITPYFNRLYRTETAFRRFYSPSVQTERAHFSTLCSVIPSFRKKIMTHHHENSFRCLPKILQEAGYTTLGLRADSDESFDNEIPFLRQIGFDHAHAMIPESLSEEEKRHVWGWGLQDDYFYKKAFRSVDNLRAKDPSRPIFAFLATVSNHTPFNEMPKEEKRLFPDAKDPREVYFNSLHMSDRMLETFFGELDRRPEFADALVFIMGDHGFGTGKHDLYVNTRGYYDELFRIPLVIRWRGHLRPELHEDLDYSEMDLAPTILDWLGISTTAPFIGVPMQRPLSRRTEPHMIHLFQPYDGMYLASLLYPWKYVYSLSDGKEFLHNLAEDPLENVNLMEGKEVSPMVPMQELKSGVRDIFKNQKLIQEDRIYPK